MSDKVFEILVSQAESHAELRVDVAHLKSDVTIVKDDVSDLKGHMARVAEAILDLKRQLEVNNEILREHHKRSTYLEEMVLPLHQERLTREAIAAYKRDTESQTRARLKLIVRWLKVPVAVATALTAIGGTIAYLMGLFGGKK